jgi:AcrR family transcriptional regulator
MTTTRPTRLQRKAQTRSDLLAAARRVFVERGFHGASVDDIAQEAGYTKGAVYSNFEDKAALYLAVLADHYERRIGAYSDIILEEDDFGAAVRSVSEFMARADAAEPGWLPLLSEFIAYAAADPALTGAYLAIRRGFLEAIARILDGAEETYGSRYRISTFEVARASSLLIRAFSAERRLDPTMTHDLFIELHSSMLDGLLEPGEPR